MKSEAPNPDAVEPLRRRSLLVGAGVIAAVAGASLSWWKRGEQAPAGPIAEPVPGFWDLQWEMPDGKTLTARSLQGRPILLNFWATWCPPCVEELPLINGFFKEHKDKGWQVVGLAIDKKSAVEPFLQKTPLDFPIGIAGMSGTDLVRSMGNLAGSLPFSVVIGSQGALLHRKPGRVNPEDLAAWAGLK